MITGELKSAQCYLQNDEGRLECLEVADGSDEMYKQQ